MELFNFICAFLFFVINVWLINCQDISLSDITKGDSLLIYNRNPTQSDKITCDFNFDVMAVDWSSSGQEISVSTDDISVSTSLKETNITGAIYGISINSVGYGEHHIAVTASLLISYSTILITYYCHEIDSSKLKFKVSNGADYRQMIVPYNSIISIEGLNYTALDGLVGGGPNFQSLFYIFKFGYNEFAILITGQGENTLDCNITLVFATGNFNLTIPSIHKYSINEDIIVSRYPNTTDYTEIGYNYSPIFTVNSNSGNYTPIYNFYQMYLLAISGTPGNYTYIGYYPSAINTVLPLTTQYETTFKFVENLVWNIATPDGNGMPSYMFSTYDYSIASSIMCTVNFNGNQLYDYSTYQYLVDENSQILGWPFGFEGSSNLLYSFKISFALFPTAQSDSISFVVSNFNRGSFQASLATTTENDPIFPKLISYELHHLYNFNYLFKLKVYSNPLVKYSNIGYIAVMFNQYRYERCTNLGNGFTEFEIIVNIFTQYTGIDVVDLLGVNTHYDVDQSFYTLEPPSKVYGPPLLNEFESYLISNVSFKFNNLNVKDQVVANILYFNYTSENVDRNKPFGLKLLDKQSNSPGLRSNYDYDNDYYSTWNPTLKLFQIEFFLPGNIKHGIVPWSLTLGNGKFGLVNTFLDDDKQLYVNESNFDAYGPIFRTVSTFSVNVPTNKVVWFLEIQDEINGFKYGNITVRGELDGSVYKYYITPQDAFSGDKYIGVYQISVDLPDKCVDQMYIFEKILLVDTFGNRATYDLSTSDIVDATENPFILYLQDPLITKSQFKCQSPIIDVTPPQLLSFTVLAGMTDKFNITFTFEAEDIESGLKYNQFPIVYASASTTIQTIQCISTIKHNTTNGAIYECVMVIPFGFGYGSDLLFSVYGFINNAGLYAGFCSETLKDLSYPYFLIDGFVLKREMVIEKTSKITTDGGDLWIIGRDLNDTVLVRITFKNGNTQQFSPNTIYSTAIKISNVIPTMDPFIVSVSNGFLIKNITVTPIFFNYPSTPSSSDSLVEPTVSPTNSPKHCLGKPECGGPNQGYCNSAVSKCICYSPWVGADCSSRVIIIPQPSTNTSSPTIEIPISGGSNDNSDNNDKETILFKSLISLISIREFDFNSILVNEYIFDKWVYNEINSTTNEYQTNITVPSIDGSTQSSITLIKVTLQWFETQSNITFANEQLIMNPSSIKFTIEISSYKFKSNLNTLQLIMSASFSSSKSNDICSLKEFGENEESNYIKIQIQDHSLYGRFIKRAIIDSKFKSIDNVLLDSSLNTINSESSAQSFIGINIPNFGSSIIIDPDFSVLLDNIDASNKDNSICSYSSSSGLSSSQLVGIIVGSIAFVTAIVVAIVYHVVKRKNEVKFNNNIQNKLQNLN